MNKKSIVAVSFFCLLLSGCDSNDHDHDHDHEIVASRETCLPKSNRKILSSKIEDISKRQKFDNACKIYDFEYTPAAPSPSDELH